MIASRNPTFGFTRVALSARVWLTASIMLGAATASLAQGFGPDPFRPYNSQYDAFVYPIAPGPFDAGANSGRLDGIRGANQFENYMNSLEGSGPRTGSGPRSGIGTPYYRANRVYDREYDRIYQPNKDVDKKFDSDQAELTALYFEYLREKDPKKRTELFRKYSRARIRTERDLASPRSVGTRTTGRSAQRAGAASELGETAQPRSRSSTSPPPALPSRTARDRIGSADSRTGSATSTTPAPSPLEDSGTSATSPRSSRAALPSEVLDRARRTDRTRIGPRGRAPGPNPMPPPDPLKP
jgi:hypothetical protein